MKELHSKKTQTVNVSNGLSLKRNEYNINCVCTHVCYTLCSENLDVVCQSLNFGSISKARVTGLVQGI